MTTFSLLVVGTFLALIAVGALLDSARPGRSLARIILAAAVCFGVFATLHAGFALATGFDPVGSFRRCLEFQGLQQKLFLNRPGGLWAVFDVWDFALGGGALPFALFVWELARTGPALPRPGGPEWRSSWLTWSAAATILVIAGSCLLTTETFRVWIFLQPLVVVPAGLALGRFGPVGRMTVYGCVWLVAVAIKSRLLFMYG